MILDDCRLVPASSLPAAGDDDVIDVDDVTPGDGETETPQEYMRRVGPPIPGPPGKWASCIRVFDPVSVSYYCLPQHFCDALL